MDTKEYAQIAAIVSGTFLLGISVGALLGHFKTVYLFKGSPLVAPTGFVYAGLPGSIAWFLIAIALAIPDRQVGRRLLFAGVFPLVLFGVVLTVWKPRWLKPKWLRWLEDNYSGDNLLNLLEEARQEGRVWGKQVRTQEGLEKWAKQTVAKYRSRASYDNAKRPKHILLPHEWTDSDKR